MRIDLWAQDGTQGHAEYGKVVFYSGSDGFRLRVYNYIGGNIEEAGLVAATTTEVLFSTIDRYILFVVKLYGFHC